MRYFRKGYNNRLVDVLNIKDEDLEEFYEKLEKEGYGYNPVFDRWTKDLWVIKEVK